MTTGLTSLPDFTLADQFGRELSRSVYQGVPLIIVIGNRDGARGVARWTAGLREAIGNATETSVLPVADMRGVPRLLRRAITRLLPRDADHWCALDWDGALSADIRGDGAPLVAAAYDSGWRLRKRLILPLDAIDSEAMNTLVESAEEL